MNVKTDDPLGSNNVKSYPESELDSVGVNTYMYDEDKSNQILKVNSEFDRFISELIQLNIMTPDDWERIK